MIFHHQVNQGRLVVGANQPKRTPMLLTRRVHLTGGQEPKDPETQEPQVEREDVWGHSPDHQPSPPFPSAQN